MKVRGDMYIEVFEKEKKNINKEKMAKALAHNCPSKKRE